LQLPSCFPPPTRSPFFFLVSVRSQHGISQQLFRVLHTINFSLFPPNPPPCFFLRLFHNVFYASGLHVSAFVPFLVPPLDLPFLFHSGRLGFNPFFFPVAPPFVFFMCYGNSPPLSVRDRPSFPFPVAYNSPLPSLSYSRPGLTYFGSPMFLTKLWFFFSPYGCNGPLWSPPKPLFVAVFLFPPLFTQFPVFLLFV